MNRLPSRGRLKKGGNLLSSTSRRTTSTSNTLRALEEALLSFGGCAVVIVRPVVPRPDRRRTSSRSRGTRRPVWYGGELVRTYEADRATAPRRAADMPHRIKSTGS